ncbi:MAG: hypothetical protein V4543_09280 [Bacteroidota bacterium]
MLACYLITDPFRILYYYENYYDQDEFASINRDMAGSRRLLHHRKQGKTYESIILGSSMAYCFRASEWEKYGHVKSAFIWNAHGESLYGVHSKIKWLDSTKYPVKNALIIIDDQMLTMPGDGHGFIHLKEPEISGGSELYRQYEGLIAYFNNYFFLAQFDYYLSGHKFRPYMKNIISDPRMFGYNPVTNDMDNLFYTRMSAEDSMNRNNNHIKYMKGVFEKNNCQMTPLKRQMLCEIKNRLQHMQTDYRIIVFPRLRHEPLCPADMAVVDSIFSADKVYRENRTTLVYDEIRDFEDDLHAKYYFGTRILKRIYSTPPMMAVPDSALKWHKK